MTYDEKVYDLIILGAGPAGLSAGIYAGRAKMDTLIIEKGQDGGQVAITAEIENYPGQLVDGESGRSLTARMTEQVERFGAGRISDTIVSVDLDGPVKTLVGFDGTYKTRQLIIATGASPKPIGCKREDEFIGKGVSFCATCDAPFFEGLDVYVVGGGDSAVEEAVYLTKYARKVTVIHRRDKLRASLHIQQKAFRNHKLFFLWDTVVEELIGDGVLNGMVVRNTKTGELSRIDADEESGMIGIFGFVGYSPRSELFEGKLEMENGYIVTDSDMNTSVKGVYAAGDVRKKSLRQAITAASDGAIAAVQAERYQE